MSGLEFRRVCDEESARAWHAVDDATRPPDLPADPLCEVLPKLHQPAESGESTELWLAMRAGSAVAAAELMLPTVDNLENATLDVRVLPEERRQGVGRALAEFLLDRVRAAGRTRVFGEIDEALDGAGGDPGEAGRVLARRLGARPVLTEIRRVLDVAALDPTDLARLRDDAAARASDYGLVQWVDRAADELLDDMAMLMARMTVDPPMEEMEWEPEVFDAGRVRAKEDDSIAKRRRRVVTAARHEPTGRLVGYTDIGVSLERPRVGYQWDTIVLHEHRGHRLGLLMKVANLELLARTITGVQLVNTWNAEVNAHMIAVNEVLGFRAVDRWREWQLDL